MWLFFFVDMQCRNMQVAHLVLKTMYNPSIGRYLHGQDEAPKSPRKAMDLERRTSAMDKQVKIHMPKQNKSTGWSWCGRGNKTCPCAPSIRFRKEIILQKISIPMFARSIDWARNNSKSIIQNQVLWSSPSSMTKIQELREPGNCLSHPSIVQPHSTPLHWHNRTPIHQIDDAITTHIMEKIIDILQAVRLDSPVPFLTADENLTSVAITSAFTGMFPPFPAIDSDSVADR